MDLSTMLKKVQRQIYRDRHGLIDDFTLMVENCHQYNGAKNGMSMSNFAVEVIDEFFIHSAYSIETSFKKGIRNCSKCCSSEAKHF